MNGQTIVLIHSTFDSACWREEYYMISGRDGRLLISLLFLIMSAVFALVQSWIVHLYIDSVIAGDWTYFSDLFFVNAPASGPDKFCFDRCVADLPLFPGYAAACCFLIGIMTLGHVWLRPRAVEPIGVSASGS